MSLISSIAMAMMEMAYEGLFGVGFWSAPVFIAATVLRNLQTVTIPVVFSLVPIIFGMMGHMVNSVVLAFVFVALLGRFPSTKTASVVGSLYALTIFFMMWFVVLPFINPVMLNLNPVVFALSHMVWGAVLGAMVARRASQ